MRAWTVTLKGKKIDCVFFSNDCDASYVRNSLINHDGYHPNIKVQ